MSSSIKVLDAGSNGEYYLRIAAYYKDMGKASAGLWLGGGRRPLGLTRYVEPEVFRALLGGKKPNGIEWLSPSFRVSPESSGRRKNGSRTRAPGYDICFSVPKSVSAIWAVADDATRKQIEAAFLRAVRRAMEWLEKNVPLGRRGRGGTQKEFVKLVAAAFLDFDSRNLQPQLHVHLVAINAGLRRDGTWCSLDSKLLHRYLQTLDSLVRTELVAELTRGELGLRAELPLDDNGKAKWHFELTGVPEALVDHWSSRRREIESAVGGLDAAAASATKASAKAMQAATLKTRRPKQQVAALPERLRAWQAEAAQFGFSHESVRRLLGQSSAGAKRGTDRRSGRGSENIDTRNFERVYRRVRRNVIRDFVTQEAHFGKRDFIRKLCDSMQHTGASLAWLLPRIEKDLKQSRDLVPLQWRDGQLRFTTKEVWKQEEKLLARAANLGRRDGAVVSPKIVERVINRRPTLTEEQARAIRDLLSQRSSLRVVTGVAGAGKSFVFDAVREALQKAGYLPIGGAISGVATEELAEKAKIPSRTLASYLWHADPTKAEKLKRLLSNEFKQLLRALIRKSRRNPNSFEFCRKHVLIVDEQGMVGTHTLNRILKLAENHGFSVVLVGDNAQLQPIEAGAPLKRLAKEFGSVHLSENFRQKDALEKQAVANLREGKAEEALASYAEQGRFHIAPSRTDAYDRIIEDWIGHGGADSPTKHTIYVDTRAEAKAINDRCQKARQERGLVRRELGVTVGKERLFVGDRVIFKAPLHEFRIRNGYQAKVVATNPLLKTVSVWLDKAPPADEHRKPGRRLVTIPIGQLGQDGLRRCYAITIHSGQGTTADHSYILLGSSMTSRESAYTQATRGKFSTRLYTDSYHASSLSGAISKSRQKDLAHDVGLLQQIERER
jgi:conjugative relaxase-like TrwC/TraI family protein